MRTLVLYCVLMYTIYRATSRQASTILKGYGIMNVIDLTPTNKPRQHLIKEQSPHYTKHDQLFKQLIEAFFEDFMEAFFPEFHDQIDFKQIAFCQRSYFQELLMATREY